MRRYAKLDESLLVGPSLLLAFNLVFRTSQDSSCSSNQYSAKLHKLRSRDLSWGRSLQEALSIIHDQLICRALDCMLLNSSYCCGCTGQNNSCWYACSASLYHVPITFLSCHSIDLHAVNLKSFHKHHINIGCLMAYTNSSLRLLFKEEPSCSYSVRVSLVADFGTNTIFFVSTFKSKANSRSMNHTALTPSGIWIACVIKTKASR